MRDGGGAFTESVPELPTDNFEMAHAAAAGCMPPLGLLAPVVTPPEPVSGVATGRTNLLLNMKAGSATSTANRVRLVVPLSERTGSLRHPGSLLHSHSPKYHSDSDVSKWKVLFLGFSRPRVLKIFVKRKKNVNKF